MSDQRDLDPLQSAGIALGRREKGKLVGRYRPARRSRNHERKPFRSPPAERGEQLSEAAAFLLAAERESAWDGLDWVRPERDQEGVISERIAGSGADGASARIDRDQRVLGVAGPGVAGHAFELDPQDVGGAERLGNQHGPVDELVRRGEELDLHEARCKRRERQHRFQPGYATAGDHHAKWLRGGCRGSRQIPPR